MTVARFASPATDIPASEPLPEAAGESRRGEARPQSRREARLAWEAAERASADAAAPRAERAPHMGTDATGRPIAGKTLGALLLNPQMNGAEPDPQSNPAGNFGSTLALTSVAVAPLSRTQLRRERNEVRLRARKRLRVRRLSFVAAVAGMTGTLIGSSTVYASAATVKAQPQISASDLADGSSLPSQWLFTDGQEVPVKGMGYSAERASGYPLSGGSGGAWPSVGDLLANPPMPSSYSLEAVYALAQRFQGVPYLAGGATPRGFDCSGFVQYVFAHFNIHLPHGVSGQAAAGRRIPISEARPGDLIIMSGHNGFYAGNGRILHAPTEGRSVHVAPIWTSSYYVVRIGV